MDGPVCCHCWGRLLNTMVQYWEDTIPDMDWGVITLTLCEFWTINVEYVVYTMCGGWEGMQRVDARSEWIERWVDTE